MRRINTHSLKNMIYQLEDKRDLGKVELTQNAVNEILAYLKTLRDVVDCSYDYEFVRLGHIQTYMTEPVIAISSLIKLRREIYSFKDDKISRRALDLKRDVLKEINTILARSRKSELR